MSCPRTREVEKRLSPAELRAFCDHAKKCDECGKLLDRVADAYRLLREDVPPLSPSRRVDLLAKIEERAEKPRLELRWFVPFAVAGAAAIRSTGSRLAPGMWPPASYSSGVRTSSTRTASRASRRAASSASTFR